MAVTNDKLLLFKSHNCSSGLDEETLREIADAAELVQVDPGDFLHHANQPVKAVFLVVHGRLKQSVVDMHGKILFHRFLSRGSQFGALGAAQADPVPVDVVALETSAVLKLDFETVVRFTRKHETFGLNLIRSISSMVSQVLLANRRPTKPSVVTIFHESAASRTLTRRLIERLLELDEHPCFMSDHTDGEAIEKIAFRSLVTNGQVITREEIRRQINEWSDSGRVIVDVDSSLDPVNAALLVEFSDQVIWCVDSDNIESSVYRLKAIEARAPGWRDKISLIWTLNNDSWVAPRAAELTGMAERDFVISFATPQTKQSTMLQDGFERLIHHLRGIRVGLALGGGGARGMAHLGVLKALSDNGIVVDMIAGTSAGAMAGILCAAGYDPEYVTDRFMEDLKPGWLFRMMPRGNHWYLLYKYRRGHFDRMLRKYLHDWTLQQLPLPVQSVTVDLIAGKPVVRDCGNAVNAILESINLPVFSKPICRDGQSLVDGGLVNNIPADVLVRAGCNFVIAVSVTAELEREFAKSTPDTPTSEMKAGSALQTILRSYLVQSVNMNSIGIEPADLVISPDVRGVDLSEFSQTRNLAKIGEQATLKALPRMRELLSQLDSQLFPSKIE